MSELAEGARLEIVCVVYSGTEGSNPSLSAIPFFIRQSRFLAHPVGGDKIPAMSDGYAEHNLSEDAIDGVSGSITQISSTDL